MVKAAILDDYQNVALKLADWSPVAKDVEVKVFNAPIGDDNAVIKALQGFAIINMMRERTPFNRKVIEGLPDLKLLITTGARNNSIDLKAAAERGVTVCGTGGVGNPTAAVAIGLMLELTRHIGFENARMKAGAPWQTTLGDDVDGKTLGVLGLGKLGTRVAATARTLGMKVIAWSQNLTPEKAKEAGADYVSKEDLFRNADVVSIHVMLERSLARPGRRERTRADEEDRLSHQHGARADRRRESADRGAEFEVDRRRRSRRLRRRAAAARPSVPQDGQCRADAASRLCHRTKLQQAVSRRRPRHPRLARRQADTSA